MKDFSKFKKKLDRVSPSFCLAKWLQVTIDLRNGETQSCHHPIRHQIPIEEIKRDYRALHNTIFKKHQRKMMLESQRPPECSYCWNIEDTNENNISDRIVKSSDNWASPYFEEVIEKGWDTMIAPTYLEVMFNNKCNLSCTYCNAATSSSIKSEIERFGLYPLKEHEFRQDYPNPLTPEEQQVYIEAFWKWLPEFYDKLHVLRVTGGEPLLDENTFKLLDYIHSTPNEKLTLAFNTNFSLPSTLTKRFFEYIKKIENKVSTTELYLSLDATGERAEYIRSGLNFELFNKNIHALRSYSQDIKITIMCTYSILSMDNFPSFLAYILDLKKQYGNIHLDISYLQNPSFLSFKLASSEQINDLEKSLGFAKENFDESGDEGFNMFEIKKIERLFHFSKTPLNVKDYTKRLVDFYTYIEEFDRRKNQHFESIFPGLKKIRRMGKKIYENIQDP